MRLQKIAAFLEEKGWKYTYREMDGLGGIDFEVGGLSYHIWEFCDGEYGAESNIRRKGKMEDFLGDYEEELLTLLKALH